MGTRSVDWGAGDQAEVLTDIKDGISWKWRPLKLNCSDLHGNSSGRQPELFQGSVCRAGALPLLEDMGHTTDNQPTTHHQGPPPCS